MMNRRFLLVLTVSFLFLPFTTTWVKNENTSAYENPADVTNYTTEAFTEKFKGTIPAKAFVGPDNAFEVVNASIHAAATSLYLEVYTLSSQNLIDSLIYAKATNGVDVIVLLEFDHVSGYEDDYTEQAAYELDNAGVEVLWTTSDYTFTHAKFWVVDSQYTYVYSGNWAPSSLPADTDARNNREMGLMFDETNIATFYEDIFFEDYAKATAYSGTDPGHTLPSEDSGTYVPVKVNPLTITEYMEVIPVFSPNNSYAMLLSLIENATSTIDVQQQYLTHTCELTFDLIDAANSGIDIRVMYPEPTTASKNVTELLLQNGIEVRFSYSLYNHNKFLLVDGETVSVSSINWSNGSVVDNREAGAIVKNTNIANYLADVFEWDWENYTHIPSGFLSDVEITKPVLNTVANGTIEVEAGFYIGPFTSGTLYIDNAVVHTWTTPDGLETYSLDTTTYTDGIHQVKVIGNPTVGDPIIVEHDFNIVNLDWWGILISDGGWTVSDNLATYTIPADTVFLADDILVFVRDSAVYTTEMNDLGITSPVYDYVYDSLILGNTGDILVLDGPHGNIDAVVWGTGTYTGVTAWTGTIDDSESLQRDPANHDTDDCSVDFIVRIPNPGTVYVTETPSGFIPGFIFSTTLSAIAVVTIVIVFSKRKK
jgi:phosphatidylserine/phosphatidylglycerophosphate/cardiolipin synthase-like enzyme